MTAEPLAIYVHWPFCRAKCPYCDFNSHVRERIDQHRWRRALLTELAHYAHLTEGRSVTSIFFGGGTPSLMAPETVAALIEAVARLWHLETDAEITLEANPTSVEAGNFAAYAAAGVNRVSLGVQALDDEALAFLGREHSAAEALAALDLARRHFARLSFDLIYARPGQSEADWTQELERALAEEPSHLSLYQLTIEPGTVFEGRARRGELDLPDEALAGAVFDLTQIRLDEAGLPAYEISNHARPGEESRHNLTYWRYDDYLGIGPGAHGRITIEGTKHATRQHRAPEAWLERVEAGGHATRTCEPLSREAQRDEMTMMGLRLSTGIERAAFRRKLGRDPEDVFDVAVLDRLLDGGFLGLDERGLRATRSGLARLDTVLGQLLA